MEQNFYDNDWYKENDASETDESEELADEDEDVEHFFVEWAGYI